MCFNGYIFWNYCFLAEVNFQKVDPRKYRILKFRLNPRHQSLIIHGKNCHPTEPSQLNVFYVIAPLSWSLQAHDVDWTYIKCWSEALVHSIYIVFALDYNKKKYKAWIKNSESKKLTDSAWHSITADKMSKILHSNEFEVCWAKKNSI